MAKPDKHYSRQVIEWLRTNYGPQPDKPFSSGRQWSLAAGRSPNTVSSIEETGRYTAETLVLLARAANEPVMRVLQTGGFLNADEIDPDVLALTPQEERLLAVHRLLTDDDRLMIGGLAERFLR